MGNKYSIAFVSSGLPFNGNSLSAFSLGGSETGVLYLAREFARQGHDILVFSGCGVKGEGNFDGVHYHDLSHWESTGVFLDLDVLIINRDYQRMIDKNRAKAIYYYSQDVIPPDHIIHQSLWQTDRIAVLSEYHKNLWTTVQPKYMDHIFEIRNGVDFEIIKKARKSVHKRSPVRDDKINFIYASRPDRGLEHLLDMWPEILKRVPNAFLTVTYYDIRNLAPDKGVTDNCLYRMSQFPDSIKVYKNGLKKFDLYRLYMGCTALLYPCIFPEISCITALEAMATDTLVITTNDFALPYTVGSSNGVLIDGHPSTNEYKVKFIEAVHEASQKNVHADKIFSARRRVESEFSWERVANLWSEEFDRFFKDRSISQLSGILKSFAVSDNHVALKNVCPPLNGTTTSSERFINQDHTSELVGHDDPEHLFPGNTSKGLALRSSLFNFIVSRESKPEKVLYLNSSKGDMPAYICKSFSNVGVQGVISLKDNLSEALDFYLKSGEDPLSTEEKSRLSFSYGSVVADQSYDIIVSEKVLDYNEDVSASATFLESFVKPGSLVVSVVRDGPWSRDLCQKDSSYFSGRVHDFDGNDLRNLFGHKKEFSSVYVTDKLNGRDEVLGYWIVSWIKTLNSTVGVIDYGRKLLTRRPYQSVSLCMITRNNEDHISLCLKSVRNLVDEVVIVDTGSTDSTLDIARKLIPQDRLVIQGITWPEDFSKARNHALELCQSDWVLWIDSDEFLTSPHNLAKYLRSRIYSGLVLRQHHLTLDTELDCDTPVRLFKKGGIKWYGVVHEQVETGMDESVRPCAPINDCEIAHLGYVTEVTRREKCYNRNMALMYKDRKENPDRRLGKLLLSREYRNIVNWKLEDSLQTHVGVTEEMVIMMREVCRIHHDNFMDKNDILHEKSFSVYQEILRMMVKLEVPARDGLVDSGIKTVPFAYDTEEGETRLKHIHFLTESEYVDYCKNYLVGASH